MTEITVAMYSYAVSVRCRLCVMRIPIRMAVPIAVAKNATSQKGAATVRPATMFTRLLSMVDQSSRDRSPNTNRKVPGTKVTSATKQKNPTTI